MLQSLIRQAEARAETQQALSKRFNVDYRRLCDYKAGRRVPSDELIGQLAEYVGINPIEAILACKLETADEEKANLWKGWLENWHSIGDSNPCYRRERAFVLLPKIWQGFYHVLQIVSTQMGIFLRGFNVGMSKQLHDVVKGRALLHQHTCESMA